MCGRFTLKTDPETLTETFPGFTTPAPDEKTTKHLNFQYMAICVIFKETNMCGRFTLKTDPETLTETFPGFTTPAPDEISLPLKRSLLCRTTARTVWNSSSGG